MALQNFFPGSAMNVTIGNQSCDSVSFSALDTLSAFTCSAPPGPGLENVQLRVRVDNAGSASFRFMYDPPRVSAISPNPCPSNTSVIVTIAGANLGRRDPATAPDPVVFIGRYCRDFEWMPGSAMGPSLGNLFPGSPKASKYCISLHHVFAVFVVLDAWGLLLQATFGATSPTLSRRKCSLAQPLSCMLVATQ